MKIVLFLASLLISTFAFSYSQSDVGISMLMVDTYNTNTDRLFIVTNRSRGDQKPECHTSNWSYVLPLDTEHQQRMYSMLLAAKMANAKVSLFGTNGCSSKSDIETLHRIELK